MSAMDVSDRGAHSELVACAWLMKLGYEVYRSVSQSSEYDLCIRRRGSEEPPEVVDVTTGRHFVHADGTAHIRVVHKKHLKRRVLVVLAGGECVWLDEDERVSRPSSKWFERKAAAWAP